MIRAIQIGLLVAWLAGQANAAIFTSTLEGDTIAAWNQYVEQFERTPPERRPVLDTRQVVLKDLNPNGGNLPDGYIHHWIAAMRIPNVSVEQVRAVIMDYAHWQQIYAPDVRLATARCLDSGSAYDLRMISEEREGPMHFAFDMHFHVRFAQAGEFQVAESRSYLIRESDSGRGPYTDLLPEGRDHGILWRLNNYWRLKQEGSSTYAECQVISLSRRPIPGSTMHVRARAKESLKSTLTETARAAGHAKAD